RHLHSIASQILPLRLGSRTDDNVTAGSARNGTLDQQQVTFGIHAHHFQGLHGHALSAHMTGHFFALENTTRSLALANGTRNAVRDGVAVSAVLSAEIPALDGTGKAFTLGLTGHIDQLTCLENFCINLITSLVFTLFEAEFQNGTTSSDIRFGEVTGLRLGHTGSATLADSYLYSAIAIALFVFELGHAIRLDLNDRNRNGDTFFGENAGHPTLTTDYTNSHVVNLMSVRGFHPLWPPISERYTTKTGRF